MRLCKEVYVLEGAKRRALYDFNRQFVIPLGDNEYELLSVLSQGKNINHQTVSQPREDIWRITNSLRMQGFIEPGRPVPRSMDFPKAKELNLPEKFKQVWFEVTNACNMTCAHCYSESSPQVNRISELNFEQWCVIAEKFLNFGVQSITFIGGEPLVRTDLVKQLSKFIHERASSVRLVIFSNLLAMQRTADWLQFLKKHRIRIGTSIYGSDSVRHDQVTNKPGSWKRTTEAVRFLTSNGIEVFCGVYIDEHEGTNREYVETCIRSLGVTEFQILAPSHVGRGVELNWKKREIANHPPSVLHFNFASPLDNMVKHNCYHDVLSVRFDGNTIPCIMTRDMPMVNMLEAEVEDIFGNEVYRTLSGLTKEKVQGCQHCEFRYGCFDCRPDARGKTGNFYKKPDCGYDPEKDIGEEI